MAKKNQTAARTVATPVADAKVNRSEMIREYHKTNPEATPAEIAKALTTDNLEFSTTLVSQVLNGRRSAGKKGLDVNMIKSAAAFVKTYKGKITEAAAAIESVGEFVELCGSKDNALAALVSFQELSEAIA